MNLFQSNHGKKSIAAAALILASAFAANHAGAKTLGTVDVPGSYNGKQPTRADAWKATWNYAWNVCRSKYKETRSINMTEHQFTNQIGETGLYFVAATWECRDTA
ncbi:hypothetical protein C2I33_15400 [Ralstonia solanacearum]|uniref:hypothetical protein n=1 Tax=Ralstonia solanacearum TaxID=305 RepID=UPI0001817196|nr:hypothetical protein [Ralstonia solanacearum]MDC6178273.1 hypothetical protein [Ralstonia solanacearum]MDC6210132.1 hypothetical protein [Ralstonia solanacearum]MDC6241753.1 hypothetical protein [Ralstonia solanacearum]MDD7801404.1 hypothetical protein [Ralstonia solanacearum]TYZ54130.1 hypothetical protein C2I33_15400 [Ralstonia solanacearum]